MKSSTKIIAVLQRKIQRGQFIIINTKGILKAANKALLNHLHENEIEYTTTTEMIEREFDISTFSSHQKMWEAVGEATGAPFRRTLMSLKEEGELSYQNPYTGVETVFVRFNDVNIEKPRHIVKSTKRVRTIKRAKA